MAGFITVTEGREGSPPSTHSWRGGGQVQAVAGASSVKVLPSGPSGLKAEGGRSRDAVRHLSLSP